MGLGVTESQVTVQILMFVTGYYGQEIWAQTGKDLLEGTFAYEFLTEKGGQISVTLFSMQIGEFIIAMCGGLAFILSILLFIHILLGTSRKIDGVLQWIPNSFMFFIRFL